MKFNPQKHHRQSIRLKGYDYSHEGAYFITICVNNRLCLFGEIIESEMYLNDPGKMVDKIWQEIPQHYPGVDVDFYIVMPNHFHGIILLINENNVEASHRGRPYKSGQGQGQTQGPYPTIERFSLGDVVGSFKSFTTYKYIDGVKNCNWKPFYKKLWQRNYYEHIIRNNGDLNRIRKYILENPLNWGEDQENFQNFKIENVNVEIH
jgi:putative transposase